MKSSTDISAGNETEREVPSLIPRDPYNKCGPFRYTPEIGALICALVSEGTSITQICQLEKIPRRTIWKWCENHKDFAQELKIAKQMRAEFLVDRSLEIADSTTWKKSTEN